MRVALPAATLDRAQPGLRDLRLLNSAGQEVPYAIDIPSAPAASRENPRQFRVELQPTSTRLTIETGTTAALDGIELATPVPTFVKAARLEISSDGEHWELIGDGLQLARGRQLEQTRLPLSKLHAKFVRVTLDDARTPVVPFTGATLLVAAATESPTVTVDAALAHREEFARETVLTLDLHARHLPLATITFETSASLFARSVTVTERRLAKGESSEETIASGLIFRARAGEQNSRERLTIPVEVSPESQELLLHIQNEDNPPLSIERIEVKRRPAALIFHAAATGNFVVLTGNARASAPRYDLSAFRDELRSAHQSAAELSPPAPNPDFKAVDVLADAPLLGPPLDVSKWAYHRSVTPAAPGVQQLELDPEVLAQAQPGFGDLRLMRDGQQAPYLLERTSLRRSLTLTPTPADDPNAPRLSRWKLKLPWAHLPVTRITLTSSTALFSRSIQVFEMISNERGEVWRSSLAAPVQWNVTPDQNERTAAVVLQVTPQSDTLWIETDNRDNPPIALAAAQLEYPVVRLLFRADDQPLELFYGNAAARPPAYDLELVAPQLLRDEKSAAQLGEPKPARADDRLFGHIKGGVLLWSSLALVVASLLFAISRLLPKPPPPR